MATADKIATSFAGFCIWLHFLGHTCLSCLPSSTIIFRNLERSLAFSSVFASGCRQSPLVFFLDTSWMTILSWALNGGPQRSINKTVASPKPEVCAPLSHSTG